MKTIIAVLLVLLIAGPVQAATLQWDYDPAAEALIEGYYVYSINVLDLGLLEPCTIRLQDPALRQYVLPEGMYLEGQTYIYWMTAIDELQESAKSNEVQWTVPFIDPPVEEIPAPWGLRLQ